MAKGGDIGYFGQAAERHCSPASASKRRGLSPRTQRAAASKLAGFCRDGWPHGAAAQLGHFDRAGMLGPLEEGLGHHGLGDQIAHRLPLVGQLGVLGRAQLGAQPVVEQRALLRVESREVGHFRRAAPPHRSPPFNP